MKLKTEDIIKKLKQNDRIEYLLRKKQIEKDYSYDIGMINVLVWVVSFFILFILGWYSAFQTYPYQIMSVMPLILKVYILFLFIDIILYLINLIKEHKLLKELDEEFFKFSLKGKR